MRNSLSVLAILVTMGCSPSGQTASTDAAVDAVGVTFPLSGRVGSVVPVDPPLRVVVGVARPQDVAQVVDCSLFVARSEASVTALPADYALDAIPLGSYSLVGIVVDASPAQAAPAEIVAIEVTEEGIRRAGMGGTTSQITIGISGELNYVCP